MPPRKAKKLSTLSPQELQEIQNLDDLYGLPSEIKQCDLLEILELQDRLRIDRDDLKSLWAELETRLSIGLRIQPGSLSVGASSDGKRVIVWADEGDCAVVQDADILF
jgi:hypothetical protein